MNWRYDKRAWWPAIRNLDNLQGLRPVSWMQLSKRPSGFSCVDAGESCTGFPDAGSGGRRGNQFAGTNPDDHGRKKIIKHRRARRSGRTITIHAALNPAHLFERHAWADDGLFHGDTTQVEGLRSR